MLRRPSFSSLSSCTFSSGSGRSSNSGSGGRSHHGSHRHHGGVPMTMVTGHLPSSVNPQYLEGTKVLRRRRRRRHFTSGGDTEQSNVGDGGATAVAVVAAWKEGIIQDVVLCEDLDEDERKSVVGGTGDADLLVVGDTRVCTVVYNKSDGGGGSGGRKNDVERLVVNETLDIWITAHFMAKLCGGGDDVRSSSTANMPPPLFSKLNASSPYSIDEFLKLMDFGVGADPEEGDDDEGEGTEDDGTTTSAQLEALEGNILVKKKSNPTEVYGRMLPRAVHKIMQDHMHLGPDHILVDLGHGIGNSCLQAAYSFGCEARGLECHKGRNDVSNVLSLKFQDAAAIHSSRDKMTFTPGAVTMKQGNLADPKHFEFLTDGVTHIFFDNWNGVFSGERPGAPNWERYVAALFASTEPGTIMTTVSPLGNTLGCLPLSEANQVRAAKDLSANDDASYYELEEHILGGKSDVYSFSEGNKSKEMIHLYVYKRTFQSTGELAIFLCNNPLCPRAKSGELLPAVTEEEAIGEGGVAGARIIGGCSCNVTDRVRRKRKKKSFD